MTVTVIAFFHAVITVRNNPLFPQAEKYPTTVFRNPISRQLTEEKHMSATASRGQSAPSRGNGQGR